MSFTTELGKILDKLTPEDSNHHVEQKKLLWTNSSPTSSFASQTITLLSSLENYDEIKILTYNVEDINSGNCEVEGQFRGDVNTHGVLSYSCYRTGANDPMIICGRKFKITSETTILFDTTFFVVTGSSSYGVAPVGSANAYLVPYKIYGIKNLES